MLINLHAKNLEELKFPSLFFERGQMIALTDICIVFDGKEKDSGRYLLTSTLLDKSPTNLKQELALVSKNHKHYVHYTPANRNFYKIQCLDFKSSQLDLIDLETEKTLKNIKYVYIQLEVINGIQQNIKTN